MKRTFTFICISILLLNGRLFAQSSDQRNISNGYSIYENGYIDQPYVVVLNDGTWLCVFTTGTGHESTPGQHIVSTLSTDKGKTWSTPVSIEPTSGPSASWATPYLTSFGRVYVFYDYNGDHVNSLNGKPIKHDSEMGWYCYKYSDDKGLTWSDRYRLPMPKAPVDFNNDFKGSVQLFWGIDKPINIDGSMIFAFTRLGKYVQSDGEGWFYRSKNIDTEKDPEKLEWKLLPDGDVGLRNPDFGSIQEEFNTVPLNSGDLYCMFRTTLGYSADSYSHDAGRTWTMPVAATYTPGGSQVLKTPRACPRVFKCSNGKYLFWFHNQKGTGFQGRNPVWISGGIEKNGLLYWSQPEILLYDSNLKVNGMSYPDLIEQDGQFWFTETQKTTARVHPVDVQLLEGMWNQAEAKAVIKNGLIFEGANLKHHKRYRLSPLPNLRQGGFSVDMWLSLHGNEPGQIVLDNRDASGKGFLIATTGEQSLTLQVSDGAITENWASDSALLSKDKLHHVVFVVDGASDIITVLVDGKLCDGGPGGNCGWGRISHQLEAVSGNKKGTLISNFDGNIRKVRVYNRYLTTSECISNFHAGLSSQ